VTDLAAGAAAAQVVEELAAAGHHHARPGVGCMALCPLTEQPAAVQADWVAERPAQVAPIAGRQLQLVESGSQRDVLMWSLLLMVDGWVEVALLVVRLLWQ
jgi:hypothetical protein